MAMIDAFYIFAKGGLLLWSTQLVKIKGNPVDWLIKEVLLEERVGETTAKKDDYGFQWKLVNEMDLFFVVVYQGIMSVTQLDRLLDLVAKGFLQHVSATFGNGLNIKHVDFDSTFLEVRRKWDTEMKEAKRAKPKVIPQKNDKSSAPAAKGKEDGKSSDNDEEGDDGDGGDDEANRNKVSGARAKLMAKGKNGAASKKEAEPAKDEKTAKAKKKEMRTWGEGKYSEKIASTLDRSKNKPGEPDDAANQAMREQFVGDSGDEEEWRKEDDAASLSSGVSDDEEDEQAEQKDKPGRVGGLFKSLTRNVKNITGGAVLSDEDLQPILQQFKTDLMTKNVGAEVATKLAESVRTSVVGKRTERFSSMTHTVKQTLKDAMETLLTPKKSIDVLRAAMAAKNAGRVYSICFIGVNGVGKSTNLAKVAYYLKHKGGMNVLICACDTFRAGAVEQLKTHSRCLDIPLFERGYGKDPALIAKQSVEYAKANGHDVVLIDTAGRMQGNEALMRAIAQLVATNKPDLVLFVGEALVGNDAIDQVQTFNRCLVDMSPDPRNPRGIDGMLLTKYDTVDDKVGAALSMVYVTGQPIVFVGTGQKYTHLKKLQAKEVVKTLLG